MRLWHLKKRDYPSKNYLQPQVQVSLLRLVFTKSPFRAGSLSSWEHWKLLNLKTVNVACLTSLTFQKDPIQLTHPHLIRVLQKNHQPYHQKEENPKHHQCREKHHQYQPHHQYSIKNQNQIQSFNHCQASNKVS